MSEVEALERGGSSPTWMVNHLPVILWQRRYYVLACFVALALAAPSDNPRMFEYFEDGEAALLRQIGYRLANEPREYDFPRVHVECQFKRILALYAPFFMRVKVGRLGRSSIRYEFDVYADEALQELACEGAMTVVAMQNGRSVELPAELRAKLTGS